MKVALNRIYGGFMLSRRGMLRYAELSGINLIPHQVAGVTHYYVNFIDEDNYYSDADIPREDINLIKTIEELRGDASDKYSDIAIVEIPDNCHWEIMNDKGKEYIIVNGKKPYHPV